MRCIDASTYTLSAPGVDRHRRTGRRTPRWAVAPTRGSALLGWVKDDAEYIATQIQTLADACKRRATAAKRAHPDAGESHEESDHAEPQ